MNSSIAAAAPAPLMSFGRLLRAYLTDAKYEALRMLRAPGFAVPFLLVPTPLYLFFGVVIAGEAAAHAAHPAQNPQSVADYLFIGFSVMAVIGPALFGVGSTLAAEREAGLMRLKRALPAPAGSYLLAKMLMSMFFAALAMALMGLAGKLAGHISFTDLQLLRFSAALVVGALPFCAMGLLVGACCSAAAASGMLFLLYMPMIYLGGLFIPLPPFLQKLVVLWPSFHLHQMAVAASGIGKFQFLPPQLSLGVLLATTVLFGGLAIRRLSRAG